MSDTKSIDKEEQDEKNAENETINQNKRRSSKKNSRYSRTEG
jgi:hypothetical protein